MPRPFPVGEPERHARLNVDRVELEDCGGPPEVGLRDAPFHGERLGGAVVEIAPGKRGWPYHWEAAQEELLLVLSGHPTLRRPGGEEVLDPGDVVAFPVGPDGAHGLRNDTETTCRLLMISTLASGNVIVYPESGKLLARSRWLEATFRSADEVPYWDG